MASFAPDNTNAVKRLVLRTAEILDEETKLLKHDPMADVTELASRKNRCLYELSTVMRDISAKGSNHDLDAELRVLKDSAMANERALSITIKANQDVVAVLGKLASENLNDGTYSNSYR